METEITIVILAAGQGTRMRSRKAKVLHRAGGQALIEHVVDTALQLTPPERVWVAVGHQADEVRQAAGNRGVRFIDQPEQKGTGHALMVGHEELARRDGQLMILYGDGPLISAATLKRLAAEQLQSGDAATLHHHRAGRPDRLRPAYCETSSTGSAAIVEQKAATPAQLLVPEINSGIYCFRAADFWARLDQIRPDNAAQEYYLTDIVGILNRAGQRVRAMRIDNPAEVLGINKPGRRRPRWTLSSARGRRRS